MKHFWNALAMTLVELIVSLSITAIVLIIIVVFISDGTENISRSLSQTKMTNDIIELNQTLKKITQTGYSEFRLMYDGPINEGMDIFILTQPDNTDGYIFAVVDTRDNTTAWIYSDYYNRVFGYRRLSSSEITTLLSDPTPLYDYKFFNDKIFPALVTRDLQVNTYNTGSIIELSFSILDADPEKYQVVDWSDIPKSDIFSFNIIL